MSPLAGKRTFGALTYESAVLGTAWCLLHTETARERAAEPEDDQTLRLCLWQRDRSGFVLTPGERKARDARRKQLIDAQQDEMVAMQDRIDRQQDTMNIMQDRIDTLEALVSRLLDVQNGQDDQEPPHREGPRWPL